MKTILYRGFRFPKAIIQHAIWLYLRFTPAGAISRSSCPP